MSLSGYADGQPRSYANQSASNISGATSTSANGSTGILGVGTSGLIQFGFGAGLIKAIVDGGGPAYLQTNGNPATTADYRLTSGDLLTDWYNLGVPLSVIAISATSTALSMRVGAWG